MEVGSAERFNGLPVFTGYGVAVGPPLRGRLMNLDANRRQVAGHRRRAVFLNDLSVSSHGDDLSTLCRTIKHKTSLDAAASQRQFRRMGVGARIKQAREGRMSQAQLGKSVGASQTTISSWERGRTEPTREDVVRVAEALGVPVGHLEAPGAAAGSMIPIVGYVGAATEFFGFDDHEKGAGLDEIEAPPGVPDGAVAVIVRGDSGYPAIRDGMILIYWNCTADPRELEGEDCFVRLADGRTLVKILERGTEAGRWTLNSINSSTPPIRNVEVEWVAPIEVRLRRRNWKGA